MMAALSSCSSTDTIASLGGLIVLHVHSVHLLVLALKFFHAPFQGVFAFVHSLFFNSAIRLGYLSKTIRSGFHIFYAWFIVSPSCSRMVFLSPSLVKSIRPLFGLFASFDTIASLRGVICEVSDFLQKFAFSTSLIGLESLRPSHLV